MCFGAGNQRTFGKISFVICAMFSLLITNSFGGEQIQKLLPELMVQLIALIDDNCVATRGYTVKTLLHIGPMRVELLKPLGAALLSRLDDPSVEVREKTAKCLGLLSMTEEEREDYENKDMWSASVKQILATMILHLESPEINLRELLLGKCTCCGILNGP